MLEFFDNKKTKIVAGFAILLGLIDLIYPSANVTLDFEGVVLDTPSEFFISGLGVFLGRDIIQKFQPK